MPRKSKYTPEELKEIKKQRQQKYRNKHKEKIRLRYLELKALNPERYNAIKKRYKDANKNKITNYELVKKYNITLEEYNSMSEIQNNLCAICKQPETRKHKSGTVSRLAVDHCHKTGKVRGLLCWRCNSAMGSFEERDVPILNIENYLEKYR